MIGQCPTRLGGTVHTERLRCSSALRTLKFGRRGTRVFCQFYGNVERSSALCEELEDEEGLKLFVGRECPRDVSGELKESVEIDTASASWRRGDVCLMAFPFRPPQIPFHFSGSPRLLSIDKARLTPS
jgi:hypothetical protein